MSGIGKTCARLAIHEKFMNMLYQDTINKICTDVEIILVDSQDTIYVHAHKIILEKIPQQKIIFSNRIFMVYFILIIFMVHFILIK
jgi:hypothetical protein